MSKRDTLVLRVTAKQGTYAHETARLYAEGSIERPINERWPDLRAGDVLEVTVRRVVFAPLESKP